MQRDYSIDRFAFFLAFTASLATLTGAVSQAPGDEDRECLTSDRPLVPNQKILMASFNYANLLSSSGGPWIVVDEDAHDQAMGGDNSGFTPTWIQSSGSDCSRLLSVCGYLSGPQENWLITQFINLTGVPQYMGIAVRYKIRSVCTFDVGCDDAVETYVLYTNEANQSFARNINSFTANHKVKDLTDATKDDVIFTYNIIWIKRDLLYSGMYVALKDKGSCFDLAEMRVYTVVCDKIALDLGANFSNTTYLGESSTGFCFRDMAVDSNTPNGTFQAVCQDISYWKGKWKVIGSDTECMCLPGYKFISDSSVNQCHACPPFTFKSTLSNTDVCHPCPLFSNTTENDTGAIVCPCDLGYYRAVNEDDLHCTRPPSAPCNLNTSDITNTTVSLQWDDALDDGNRSDLFYTILENISNISHDTNTTTFTLENLIPFVHYEIRVTAENGVSSQDPWVENRSLTISVMTLEGIPPPINLTYINDTVQLYKPIYPHGKILQYQIAAMRESSNITSASLNTSILNVSTSLLLTQPGAYLVKARAFTIIGAGPYGEPVLITISGSTANKHSYILIIAITVGAALVVVFLAIVVNYIRKRRIRNRTYTAMRRIIQQDGMTNFISLNNTDTSSTYTLLVAQSALTAEMKKQLMAFMIEYNNLDIKEKVAKGKFGVVYKGQYTTNEQSVEVAIKTMKDLTSYTAEEFIAECNIANKFDHPNVLSLIGVSIVPEDDIPLMVMPYMLHGDVKSYLKSQRGDSVDADELPVDLTYNVLMRMCLDIAQGMEYFSSKRYVHRDLAARNCMLDESMMVKVADFGLSRDVYETDYYVMQHSVPLPVKWLAPEALFDRVFTEKTDVWAFGVTCWEIFSLGLEPYPMVDKSEIGDYLKCGRIPNKPMLSSDDMYNVMKACWNFVPDERPSFALLVTTIGQQL